MQLIDPCNSDEAVDFVLLTLSGRNCGDCPCCVCGYNEIIVTSETVPNGLAWDAPYL